jgi:hypothetical protein
MEKSWPGQHFYDSKFLGGNAVLEYNTSHKFWSAVDALIEQLDNPDAPAVDVAREIRVMVDLLLIAHAKAESMFSPDAEFTAQDFTDMIRMQWGQYLTSYVNARAKVTP